MFLGKSPLEVLARFPNRLDRISSLGRFLCLEIPKAALQPCRAGLTHRSEAPPQMGSLTASIVWLIFPRAQRRPTAKNAERNTTTHKKLHQITLFQLPSLSFYS